MNTNTTTTQSSAVFSRKFLAALLAFAFVCSAPAFSQAAFSNSSGQNTAVGGFSGPGPGLLTVEQAKGMSDDSYVAVKGSIVQQLGDEKYLFKDATGTITVEIDHDVWMGQNIGPQDVVEIHGELDKDLFSAEIDVDRIVKQ